jgi:hypothetical protein
MTRDPNGNLEPHTYPELVAIINDLDKRVLALETELTEVKKITISGAREAHDVRVMGPMRFK